MRTKDPASRRVQVEDTELTGPPTAPGVCLAGVLVSCVESRDQGASYCPQAWPTFGSKPRPLCQAQGQDERCGLRSQDEGQGGCAVSSRGDTTPHVSDLGESQPCATNEETVSEPPPLR